MSVIYFPLIIPTPFLDSCAGDITASIILDTASSAPSWVGGGKPDRIVKTVFSLRYMVSPARERNFYLYMYDTSDWAQRCILLAAYLILAAGCVAA